MNEPTKEPSPQEIVDLAEGCVRFVERALGVKLDYEPETLPLLDHYIDLTRKAAGEKPEAIEVVALSAGAYFGEVVRRRFPCWWRIDKGLSVARIEFGDMFLSFSPMDTILIALRLKPAAPAPANGASHDPAALAALPAGTNGALDTRTEESEEDDDEEEEEVEVVEEEPEVAGYEDVAQFDLAGFELDEADQPVVAARLAELPPVRVEEYYAPSTRLEVLDITVDCVRAKRLGEGDPELALEPEDYD